MILSNILDLLFLQWFSCASAAVLRWPCLGRALKVVATMQERSSWPAAAQTQTAAILATVHHRHTHAHTNTPLHGVHTQPKSSGPTLDCYQITAFSPSVTPSLLTAQSWPHCFRSERSLYLLLAYTRSSRHMQERRQTLFLYSKLTDARVTQNAPMLGQRQIPMHKW